MADLIQLRRDTLERWEKYNPVLAEGELGLVLGETNRYKVGDGVRAWNDLPLRGFNGNIVEELGESYDAVISQHGMNKLLKYIINNGSQVEVGTDWRILDSITNAGVYIITKGGLPVHHMMVCWDYTAHQHNQWIFGNLIINQDGSVDGTHADGTANIIHRSKDVASTADWSRWKYLQEYFLKEATGSNSHYSVSQKFFTETISGLSNDMTTMEIELKKEFSSQNTQLQNAINSLQTKFDNLNTRADSIEDLANTALNDADKAFRISESNSASRFHGFINTIPVDDKSTDAGVVKFNHLTNNFVYVVSSGNVITAYSKFDGDNLFNTTSHTRKNKVYINDADLYVYDEAGNFIKVGRNYQIAIDILNQKAGAIIHCNNLINDVTSDLEPGHYLVADSKGKVIRLVKVADGGHVDVKPEVGYIIECGGLYYGWNGKLFNAIGGGSGSGSGSGFYNVSKEHPLQSGEYYTLAAAVAKLSESDIDEDDRKGMIITFESSAGNWEDYRYVGTSVDDGTFLNHESWREHSFKDVVKKITYSIGSNAAQELIPDAQGNVNLNVPSIEAIETVDPNSTNPPQSKAVAAELQSISKKYGTALRLNTIGNGADKAFSITLLAESGEELSTTDMFTGGGGSGNIQATKIVLTRLTPNPTVKSGDEVKLSYKYDHVDTTSEESTGESGKATVTISRGATSNSFTQIITAGSVETLDVTKYIDVGVNSVRVKVEVGEDETKQVSIISWSVNVIALSLSSSFDFATVVNVGATVTIPYYLTGSGLKRLMCYVDGVVADTKEINSSTSQGVFMIPTAGKSHGNMSVQLVAETDVTNGTVKSNSIYFDLVLQGGLSTPIVGARFDYKDGDIIRQGARPYLPAKQFENYEIKYAAYDKLNANKQVVVKAGGVTISTAIVLFVQKSVIHRSVVQGRIPVTITTGGTTYSFDIVVSKADVELNEPTSNLVFKFDASGKSNNDADKTTWLSSMGNVTATLTDVRYSGDGWTGEALKLTNRGRMTVNYQPLNVSNSGVENSFVFQTKLKISSVTNDDAVLLSCVDNEGTGFLITATSAKMVTRGKSEVSMALTADTLYNIAFVSHPVAKASSSDYEKLNTGVVYLYIDGVCAGAVQRDNAESIYQANPVNITAGSAEATLELYGMRHYNGYLSDADILNLHIVDLSDAELISKKYMENDLLDGEGNITVDKVPDDVRYIVVTGVQTNDTPTLLHAAVINNKSARYDVTEILHVKKSEPQLNFKLVGGCIRLQGTSSLAYPIKNYRFYIKNSAKKAGKLYLGVDATGNGGTLSEKPKYSFKVVSDTGKKPAPVDCWCLKADYAESSSTHNTGLARLANKLLTEIAPTPPQKHVSPSYEYDVRTTVDGEPCYLFYRKTVDDKPVFLGKYNLNNDKSTEDVFGFLNIPGYHDQSWVQSQFGGKNPTECWEFLNNDYPMGQFLDDDFDAKVLVDGKQVANWTRVFEARFPDNDTMNAKYASGEVKPQHLERFVKWVKSTKDNPAKFKAELKDYADVMHLCHYYNITDVFGAVDQRVKNTMMAFWYNPDVQKMLAYFIFYDNDTIIGVRNDGRLKYKWDIDENSTDPELSVGGKTVYVYAGHDSVLWQNLRTQFKDELAESYRQIRQKLTNDEVFKMFDKLQSAKFAEIIYNKDAQYKYVAPKTKGVDVMQNGVLSKQHYSYLESLQGDRKSHRRWWLINRFHLFDAKYGTGNYTLTDLTWKGYSSAGAKIKATANRDTYLQVRREGTVMTHDKVVKGQEWSYVYNNEANIGTIFHFYGGVFTERLDLSGWGGFTDLNIPVLPALKELVLGRAGGSYSLTALSISTKLPMLEKLDIQNYIGLPTLDLTGCERLKRINARGCTSMTSIGIAEGAPIEQLVLPNALSTLALKGLDITNDRVQFPDGNGVKTLIVENCPNIDWEQLYATLGGITHLRITGINKRGGVDWLNKYKALGGVNVKGGSTDYCALVGTYQLTTYLDEQDFVSLQAQFPELNIKRPDYSRYAIYQNIANQACIHNDDNGTGYDPSLSIQTKPYVVSGHIKTILSRIHRYMGKHATQGVQHIMQLDDNDSTKYVDGTPANTTGGDGDMWTKFPKFWYKGVNDIINDKLYACYSANEEKPAVSPNIHVLDIKDRIEGVGNKYIDTTASDIASAIKNTETKGVVAVAKYDVSGGYKKVRFQSIPNSTQSGKAENWTNIGALFLDASDNIVGRVCVQDERMAPGQYLIVDIPENAKYLYYTYVIIEELMDTRVILGNEMAQIEDFEPKWMESKEFLTSTFNLIEDDNSKLASISNRPSASSQQEFKVFNSDIAIDDALAVRGWSHIEYEKLKNIGWLMTLKYGKFRVKSIVGDSDRAELRKVGGSVTHGVNDTFNNGYYVMDEFGSNNFIQNSDFHVNCLGLENIFSHMYHAGKCVSRKQLKIFNAGNARVGHIGIVYYISDAGNSLASAFTSLNTYNVLNYSSVSKSGWLTRFTFGRTMDVFPVGLNENASNSTYFSTRGGNEFSTQNKTSAKTGIAVSFNGGEQSKSALDTYSDFVQATHSKIRSVWAFSIKEETSVSVFKSLQKLN